MLQRQRLLINPRGRSSESRTGENPTYGLTRGPRETTCDIGRLARRIKNIGGYAIPNSPMPQSCTEALLYYCAWIMSSWTTLPVSSREAVCEHVRSSDFPEHPDTLSQMARAAGLSAAQELSAWRWHRCWWFQRTSGM